jgi:2,4-dienoyl-CoA reductase (NADPH2)
MELSDHPRFPYLFTPLRIKNARIRNRVVISGHHAGWWVDKGLPSQEYADYVEERARGGVGLFVMGATSPERGSGWLENIGDEIIPRYAMIAEAGHRHGTAVFAQLCHPGYRPLPGALIVASPPGAPSTQPAYRGPDRYEPTVEDLQRLIFAFGAAAGRAAQGGVDGLELHSHESFLHAQMLNPLWNTRTDAYGGALENRMRFMIETLEAMRAAAPELPLGVRLKLDDVAQRGMTAEDYLTAIRKLETLGLVDYVNVSGGDGRFHHGPMPRPEGEWLPLVERLRAATKLPLMHAGHIATPEMAEQALAAGWLDAVVMTKTHICDPHFTRKAFENRLDDIRYCTRCLQSCHGAMHRMTCVYNPVTSREATWATLEPAARKKRVVVVGGGPAGMECALMAAQRGHEIVVLEKTDRVGGMVWLGAISPLRTNWARIAEFYTRQAAKGLFEVRLNMEATAHSILALRPDAVVIATGARPNRLEIPNGSAALTVHEALNGAADVARRVVVFDRQGFNQPQVVVDYLSSRGVQVDYVTAFVNIQMVGDGMMLEEMWEQLQARGVRFSCGEEIAGWDAPGRLRLRSVQTAEERVLEGIDMVVAAIGSAPVNELAHALRGQVPELHVIGDANVPQTVEAATYQGGRIARLL